MPWYDRSSADFVSGDASEEQLTRALRENGALNGRIHSGLVRLESPAVMLGSCMIKEPLMLEATGSEDALHGQLVWQGKHFSLIGHKKSIEMFDSQLWRSSR